MQSRFTNLCLSLIVLLLLAIACQPLFEPKTTHAAGSVQYKVAEIKIREEMKGGLSEYRGDKAIENDLNELGRDGWTLVACPSGFDHCIFKR